METIYQAVTQAENHLQEALKKLELNPGETGLNPFAVAKEVKEALRWISAVRSDLSPGAGIR